MKNGIRASMSDAQKFSLVRREAIYTGLALIGLIIFWLCAGFGTAALDVKIFHLPLWAVLGSIGVWLVAILISALLSQKLFTDIDFDDEDTEELEFVKRGKRDRGAGSGKRDKHGKLERGGEHDE